LRQISKLLGNGWGMLPVQAQIGKTIWKTSLFPQAKDQTYLLPVKAAVRKAEQLEVGNLVAVTLEVVAKI
jgi:hypothetical protein